MVAHLAGTIIHHILTTLMEVTIMETIFIIMATTIALVIIIHMVDTVTTTIQIITGDGNYFHNKG